MWKHLTHDYVSNASEVIALPLQEKTLFNSSSWEHCFCQTASNDCISIFSRAVDPARDQMQKTEIPQKDLQYYYDKKKKVGIGINGIKTATIVCKIVDIQVELYR